MISIPKDSGSMGDMKNYRDIALSSLLSKLFDTCGISSQFDSLFFNDLQIAYKSQTSTIQCFFFRYRDCKLLYWSFRTYIYVSRRGKRDLKSEK